MRAQIISSHALHYKMMNTHDQIDSNKSSLIYTRKRTRIHSKTDNMFVHKLSIQEIQERINAIKRL